MSGDDNSSWPPDVERPPWQVAVTGAYAAPFPADEQREYVPPIETSPVVHEPPVVIDDGYKLKFEMLRAAVKMAVKSYEVVGHDGYEGAMEGLKDALEEVK